MYEVLYILAIIGLLTYLYYSSYKPTLVYVRSNVDNRVYVVRNMPSKRKAANTIAKVRLKLETLVDKLKKKYKEKDGRINILKKRFNPDEIRESLPKGKQTSYSINKGERIVMCLRSRNQQEKIIDINTLVFVALHELAHIMTISIGHKPEFWENFRFLLAHAIHWKIYTPVDYQNRPKPYCGMKITDSPLLTTDVPKYL